MNKPLKEDAAVLLKRLVFRSAHRGCKETDLLLGRFAQDRLAALDAKGLAAYEAFLEENDADIWNWLTGKEQARPEYEPILSLLRQYPHQNTQ